MGGTMSGYDGPPAAVSGPVVAVPFGSAGKSEAIQACDEFDGPAGVVDGIPDRPGVCWSTVVTESDYDPGQHYITETYDPDHWVHDDLIEAVRTQARP